jgi:hypothetical protein
MENQLLDNIEGTRRPLEVVGVLVGQPGVCNLLADNNYPIVIVISSLHSYSF